MKSLLILGFNARAAAWSASRANWRPYSVDSFADADLRSLGPAVQIAKFPNELETAERQSPPGPWIFTGGLENYPAIIGRIASRRELLGSPAATIRATRDPIRFARALHDAGIETPAICSKLPATIGAERWLLKRRRSSAGMHVRRALPNDKPLPGEYRQRFIEGVALGAVFVGTRGAAKLLGVTKQLSGCAWWAPGEFVYAGSLGPLPFSAQYRATLESIGDALTSAFELRGLFNVDLIDDGNRLWPLEINPRYSASVEILERAGGWSAIEYHVAACRLGELPTESPVTHQSFHGKAILYAPGPCELTNPEELSALFNSSPGAPAIADIPSHPQRFETGQPVVTVFASGENEPDVQRELRARLNRVKEMLSTIND